MATPVLTRLNYTELNDADSNTGWNDLTTADTDIKVEGTGSMSGIFRADGEQGYYDNGSAPSTGAGKTFRGWIFTNNIAYMAAEATDPYKLLVYDGTTTETATLFGSDTYPGGWYNWVYDMDLFTTVTLANVQRWGVEAGHASNAKNVINTWMDVMRYLDGYSMTGGTSGDPITAANIATVDKTDTANSTGAYNVFYVSPDAVNVFFVTGDVQFGTGATTTYVEFDGDVITFKDLPVATGLYSFSGVGSGTNVTITDCLIQAAGTGDSTRFIFDMSDTNLNSFVMTNTRLVRAAASTFKSGQTVTGNTFEDCSQITHGGADMDNCVISGYEGTTGTAALVYNVAADPDGEMDGVTFVKGTATTHAIEFGSSTPSSVTLTGQTYTGYNASNGQNDSTFYNNTGGALTINISGGSGNTTYRNGSGASTTVSVSYSVTVTCKDSNGDPIQGINVRIETDPAGSLLGNGTTNASGVYSYSHTASVPQDVKIIARQKAYRPNQAFDTITSDGLNVSFTMIDNPVVNLP